MFYWYWSLVIFFVYLLVSFYKIIHVIKLYSILTICDWLVGLSLPCWTSAPVLCLLTWRARFIRQWRMLGYVSWPSLIAHLYGMCNYISIRKVFEVAINTLCIHLVQFICQQLSSEQQGANFNFLVEYILHNFMFYTHTVQGVTVTYPYLWIFQSVSILPVANVYWTFFYNLFCFCMINHITYWWRVYSHF